MKPTLTRADNLFDFFHARVEDAKNEASLDISDDTALYLASLLTDRARVDRPIDDSETLAELHARAAHAPPGRQASTYRELGDRSLYLLGFFREHLDRRRRVIGPGYYEEMGSAAYLKVDFVLKRWFSDAFGPVFRELAQGFRECVDLLDRVRTRDADETGLLAAYDAWLVDGDPGSAATLYAGGLLLPNDPTDEC
ncbi:MAG: hypothetical protein H6737_07725 [Alphaproteobacteria bacterium]|nr:hypothetical protein [Alphaproteobacteria bacterium]